MNAGHILEISVETVEAAIAAQRGGAHSIELCSDLSAGGLTPSAELIRSVREKVQLPIFVMIRPHASDFVYSDAEFESMRDDIASFKQLGVDGVVLGLLRRNRRVDIPRTRELVQLAQPLPVTFHRAFDEAADLHGALEDVIQTGARRILTSGGAPTAPEGAAALANLVAAAKNRVIIVPGSGINAANITQVAHQTRAREFHSGLGTRIPYGSSDYSLFEGEIRKMARVLAGQV